MDTATSVHFIFPFLFFFLFSFFFGGIINAREKLGTNLKTCQFLFFFFFLSRRRRVEFSKQRRKLRLRFVYELSEITIVQLARYSRPSSPPASVNP